MLDLCLNPSDIKSKKNNTNLSPPYWGAHKTIIMNNKFEISQSITPKGMLELFHQSVCSHSIGYGIICLDMEDMHRKEAKASLLEKHGEGFYPCIEDIWTEILRLGKPLYYVEYDEYDDTNTTKTFWLTDLLDNFHKVESYIITAFLNEEDDACTHDDFLQTLLLGEVVYC